MPVAVENRLRKEAFSKNLTGSRADAYVFGTMKKLGLLKSKFKPADHPNPQPVLSTGLAGVKKGKKVSLMALMGPQ